MKTLPKEVIDLFPMWEYKCLKCLTYVDSDIVHCPKCLAPFDALSWRVPPRFLSSHKAMSKYAHEVLAPKLSSKQRELLFQYFTTIFSDGFETGDLSNWSYPATEGDGVVTVESNNPHHGTYNLKSIIPTSGSAVAIKTFASQSVVYLRAYHKLTAMPASGEVVYLHSVRKDYNNQVYSGVKNVGGSVFWVLDVRIDGSGHVVQEGSASNPVADTWYCLETMRDVTNNIAKLWGDGTLKVTDSGYTYSQANQAIIVGAIGATYTATICSDCVVAADTYVQLEVVAGVTLDGKTLNVLGFGEDARAVRSEWDAWVDGAYKRKVKVLGISREWILSCVENEIAWANSQAKSFEETAAAGFTVTFSITSEVRVINTTVYILDVGIHVADLAGKNVRHFTLTLQEA